MLFLQIYTIDQISIKEQIFSKKAKNQNFFLID